ncbi:uncharacterized protein LOC110440948 [Mizuhopecten yessoensis]|uniref:uncharacterized protein LOC110440948 n=1 Tax=Mizuhopecten yessoensis TaxID=6573 RepID=UPI000B45941C|nr:uncharacterized protein LOC110440948 [Mizuhopecten yessoensis]
MYRERNSELPPQPTTHDAINVLGEWQETTTGAQFLLADDGDHNKILVFGTTGNLHHLSNADTIFGDGTFYASPVLFTQLYALHALIKDEMYPLIFAFLPDKCQISYQRLFEIVKTAAANNNTQLNPTTIFLDFESSARNAAETVFPQASIKGCLFPYCKRIWRKVQKLRLADQYTNDNLLNLHIRRASALPLVPINQVDDVWFHAIED